MGKMQRGGSRLVRDTPSHLANWPGSGKPYPLQACLAAMRGRAQKRLHAVSDKYHLEHRIGLIRRALIFLITNE